MNEQLSKELGLKIKNSYLEWEHLYLYGGNDPFYSDGTNLMLISNHISYFKRECEKQLEPDDYPPEYFMDPPLNISYDYMARPAEIRLNAKKTLNVLLNDDNYLFLLDNISKLPPKERKELSIDNIIGYIKDLKVFIDADNLIGMRRYENADIYLNSFLSCRRKLEQYIDNRENVLPLGQLSMFDLYRLSY